MKSELKHNKSNQIIFIILVLFLLSDFTFSFFQYYQCPLLGDIETGVLENSVIRHILDDPFGFNAVQTGEKHVNPNRFFSHFLFFHYFRNVPHWLQHFTDPVSSVYLASALLKLITQIAFLLILASFISQSNNPLNRRFLLSTIIITPLFQVYGYWSRIGISDQSIAYTFFYALPLVLLMLFLLPLFRDILNQKKIRHWQSVYLIPLAIILPFSGPLIPAVIVLTSSLIFLNYLINDRSLKIMQRVRQIPIRISLILLPITFWSLYSIFLGIFYDSNYQAESMPLLERFYQLPGGIWSQIFHSLGFPLMLMVTGINVYLLVKNNHPEKKLLLRILQWVGIFILLYTLLLPLGGYRPYRARIIRYDTWMPVTVSLITLFGATAYHLIHYLKGDKRIKYIGGLAAVLLIYTFSDTGGQGKNRCEREVLELMARSNDTIIPIPADCFVLSWDNISDFRQSDKKAELIHYWGITREKKWFYNETDPPSPQ
jgi:hypothetical protein